MSIRYESVIILVKVALAAVLIEWIGFSYAGKWMNNESKWSLWACFLSVEIALNMSLWLKRITSGLAIRFKEYSFNRLAKASVDCGKGPLSQNMVVFLGECSKILGQRFERITGLPGKVLAWPGLLCVATTVMLYIIGIPPWAERCIIVLILPGLLYYLFVLLAYCDIIVQMDGVCIDLRQTESEGFETSKLLPEVINMGKEAGILLH